MDSWSQISLINPVSRWSNLVSMDSYAEMKTKSWEVCVLEKLYGKIYIREICKLGFVGRFPELSLFSGFSAHYIVKWYVFSLIFALIRNPQGNKGNFCLNITRYFIKKSCGISFCFSCWVSVNIHCGTDIRVNRALQHLPYH